MGGCKDETFSFAGDYRIVVNGGRGGSLSKAIGGYGASITMDIRVKKAGLSYNLCAGGNGGAGGQSCTTYTSTCTSGPSGEKEHYSCEKQNCTPASGAGGASSIGFGGGTGCNKNNNCGGNGGGNYGGAGGDGYSSSGGSGGGAASALYIGGAAIAIAGGGGGADGENQAKYSGGSAANYNVPDPSGWGLHTSAGGGGGASKVPAKGSGTSDYEILEVSVGTSAGGSASMSGIRPDSK
jgi:hypothetical protein